MQFSVQSSWINFDSQSKWLVSKSGEDWWNLWQSLCKCLGLCIHCSNNVWRGVENRYCTTQPWLPSEHVPCLATFVRIASNNSSSCHLWTSSEQFSVLLIIVLGTVVPCTYSRIYICIGCWKLLLSKQILVMYGVNIGLPIKTCSDINV